MLPLQVIDSFLLDYNVGQALLLVFILVMLGSLPLKSRRVLAANAILFGIIFIVTPSALVPVHYAFLGFTLVVVGPLLWVTGSR
jgi:hypothetical protein